MHAAAHAAARPPQRPGLLAQQPGRQQPRQLGLVRPGMSGQTNSRQQQHFIITTIIIMTIIIII